ncbi:MAG: DNA-3-methyladenine glycosylase I [Methylomonas sp.]|nr:DNA-3-methyladenine glycosylase I [Methylomonas sp.]PPD20728.1 MAG: DNA-3-methyladenine glycosylase I [Methylomonas sp.]PPD26225.1 MAG: DNA-3-methyladenine glycosylase I [Methylomonas sp.]PPD37943.1 MAG: DNA-3-methyladenine glycosylase I [Methylomonas sp.]PPD54629.1 MAG: DNA-3-methyladenine glycosylase I [Methylomonas sp.]
MKCRWALASAAEEHYHDHEWGVPRHDDQVLFEFLLLEGAQAGLSWRTVLEKRPSYRQAFDDFDADKIAGYDADKICQLMNDPGIIRNRLKIQSAVRNAQAFLAIQQQYGSFDAYIWRFVDGQTRHNHWCYPHELPAFTDDSIRMSRDLQKHGFSFVGKTICYAYMQAVGMVNDHTTDCFRHRQLSPNRP